MICYAGKQGSGKSYLMTREMYSLAHSTKSHTNILICNWETSLSDYKIRSGDEFFLVLKAIRIYREQHGWDLNCTFHIFMDEVGSIFNAREFKNLGADEIGFLTQLRKTGIFLYYGVQHPRFVDITFRRITDEIKMCSPSYEVGKMNMSGKRQPWGFEVKKMGYDEENIDSEKLIEIDKYIVFLQQKYTKFFTTTECIEDRFEVPEDENFQRKYIVDFGIRIDSILNSKKQTFFSKFMSRFYLPNPFWKLS